MEKPLFTKTRFAPTPSGFLHLGNIYSFAFTAALAQKYNAKIFLRIDDLFREQLDIQHVHDIFDTLNFLIIPWDMGPKNMQEYEQQYSQMHRLGMYRKALGQLVDKGRVYACTCTRTEVGRLSADHAYTGTCRDKNLPLDTKDAWWRLRTDNTKELSVKTLDGVVTTTLPATMQDFVIKRKDGYPAYQLTSVLDDIYFGIDLVVRGQDLWDSTLAQQYVASLLGENNFGNTIFYHHPLLITADGSKMSKTAGATSVQYYREQHKQPADVFALVAGMMGITERPNTWEDLINTYALY